MSILDRFKKQAPEAVVESPDRNLLAAILVELKIANELRVFRLNPDDVQRKHIATARGVHDGS